MQQGLFTHFKESIRGRITFYMVTVMLLMVVPVLASIGMMTNYAARYHDVIMRMERISSLEPVINDHLLAEMWSVVAGRETFLGGTQYETLNTVMVEMDAIIAQNSASRMEMTVARNTMNTLLRYIDNMGAQMQSGSSVDENVEILTEIRSVGALVVEMLGDAIAAELNDSMSASNRLQNVVRITLIVELGLLIGTLVFATLAQRSLGQTISKPIEQLKNFAGMIASGHLDVRAPNSDVSELSELTHSLNTMAGKLSEQIKENKREQENLKKSEMRALQAQITPHFLYNTLDAIIWLAQSRKVGEVINVTRALSDFFRISLSGGRDWITLKQEVAHLQGYLTIQKIRYRDILDYDIHVDESLYDLYILKLVIQPLVENAIYHGIKNRRGGGKLTVTVAMQGNNLAVSVGDNGAGMTPQRLQIVRDVFNASSAPDSETGYGLYSVDKRIKLYYNQSQGLSVDSVEGECTVISFSVPIRISGGNGDA